MKLFCPIRLKRRTHGIQTLLAIFPMGRPLYYHDRELVGDFTFLSNPLDSRTLDAETSVSVGIFWILQGHRVSKDDKTRCKQRAHLLSLIITYLNELVGDRVPQA